MHKLSPVLINILGCDPFDRENSMLSGAIEEYEKNNQLTDEPIRLMSTGEYIASYDDPTELICEAIGAEHFDTAEHKSAGAILDAVLEGDHAEAGRIIDGLLRKFAQEIIDRKGLETEE